MAIVTTNYTSSGTTAFVAPAGVTSVRVELWGGGGSGGSGGSAAAGGGGAYSKSYAVPVTPGSSYNVVVGGIASDSTFGGTLVVAKGGTSASGTTFGAGGSASSGTGDVRYSGGRGGNGSGEGSTGCSGGGGGAAGPSGNGVDGTSGPPGDGNNNSGPGGAGNAGSGGAGGTHIGGTDNGGPGGASVLGGGGGCGGENNGTGGAGGLCGGGGGGGESGAGAGAVGQAIVIYSLGFSNAIIDDVACFNRDLSSTEVLQLFADGGFFLSYSSALSSETLISSPSGGQANGMAYYNNYIYLSSNTNIDRYGPLNGTPAYTASVWTGATLGSQTALTNTTYGFQASYSFPNHPMVVHGDNSMYVCDYINGQGKIHRVKTTKTTFEGDTNNSSLYGALTLPFGFLPTDIQSWGTDLVILAVQTTDTVINQGRSALFFWDASATNFYKGPLYLPDSLATALEILNGQLYIWSGNAQGGVRLSKYIGGDSIQEVLFQEEGTPPPPGATSVYGNRLYWGNHITYPSDVLGVFSWGSKTEKLPAGLHCVARPTNTSQTMPAITALLPAQQSSGSRNKVLIAWRDSVGYGIDKYSTTGMYNSVWRSEIEKTGGKFTITSIRIPLGESVTAGMSIVPKILIDDISTTVTLPTISDTLYSGAKKVNYYSLELNGCTGQDNFMLELNWSGTVALPATVPILIEYEVWEDENISS